MKTAYLLYRHENPIFNIQCGRAKSEIKYIQPSNHTRRTDYDKTYARITYTRPGINNLQGSQAEKSEAHQSALQKLEARQLDLMQQLELLIFAFSSTALLVFDNILTLQMSQSLAQQSEAVFSIDLTPFAYTLLQKLLYIVLPKKFLHQLESSKLHQFSREAQT